MYSGTTVGKKSGSWVGVHQRIDRVAHRHLRSLLPTSSKFPTISAVLHFEGDNGPDAVKRKSPSRDEPWHYIDPTNAKDRTLLTMINDHRLNLAKALKTGNQERAAFEAAWMAHAIVDGLTPAHHYPLADKIEELFGKPHYERISVKEKNLIKGDNRRDTLKKNWEYWGGGGIFSTHALFEFGTATILIGTRFEDITIKKTDLAKVKKDGYEVTFMNILKQVVDLGTYESFSLGGWTWRLARKVRKQLTPLIIKAVVLGWYAAILESEVKK